MVCNTMIVGSNPTMLFSSTNSNFLIVLDITHNNMVTVLRDTYSKILYNQNVKLFRVNKVSSLRSNSIMVSVPDCLSGYQGSIPC